MSAVAFLSKKTQKNTLRKYLFFAGSGAIPLLVLFQFDQNPIRVDDVVIVQHDTVIPVFC